MEELNCIKESKEYQDNCNDPSNFLKQQVDEMMGKETSVKKFYKIKAKLKDQKVELQELNNIYKATCEDLERLKIKEKCLLN